MIRWSARARPLEPGALVAPRSVVPSLFARIGQIDDERLSRLRGVSTPDAWIIVGAAEDLPWVEGLIYLARDPEARSLYVPTYKRLEPSAALIERALGASRAPYALWGTCYASLAAARALDRDVLSEDARDARSEDAR